jgi:hypothetical protein
MASTGHNIYLININVSVLVPTSCVWGNMNQGSLLGTALVLEAEICNEAGIGEVAVEEGEEEQMQMKMIVSRKSKYEVHVSQRCRRL